jgi:glycine cleavage system H protein
MSGLEQHRYTKTHEWIRAEADGTASVGISDFAQHQVTDIVYVELPKVGRVVKAGEECAVIESVKSAFSIYAPVSGEIVKVNQTLVKDPGLVNRSPYDEGWFLALKLSDPVELQALMTHEQYEQFTAAAPH